MKKLLQIIGLIVVLLVCGLSIAVCSNMKAEDETPLNAPPELSHTQIAQTVLAEIMPPTDEPPTPVPTVSANQEFIEYGSQIAVIAELCAQTNYEIGEYFTRASEDSYLLLDDKFMNEMNLKLDDYDLFCTNFYRENPPAGMEQANEYLRLADTEYQSFVDKARLGMTNLDVELLNEAVVHMNQGSDYIVLATSEMENYMP